MPLTGANIFVTGATGLIGGELVRTLIRQRVGKVWALVRPSGESDPATRLLERLRRSDPDNLGHFNHDIRAVAGDIGQPDWGLDEHDQAETRREADIIIHSAAETSFIRTLACRRTNIAGSRHLIEFARSCARNPLVVYISTAYVSGVIAHRCMSEEEGCQPENRHHNEYTRSKAVAEELVRNSGLRVLVVRPSIVLSAGLPDLHFARAILWFVPWLNVFDAVPIDPAARPDIVPVSFVVESVIRLIQARKRRYDCYHISCGTEGAANFDHLGNIFDEFFHRSQPMRMIPPSQWSRDVHRHYVRTPEQRKVFASLRNYLPFLNMDVLFDNRRLREELGPRLPKFMPLSDYMGDLLSLIPNGILESRGITV